jgi:hypothetical protein
MSGNSFLGYGLALVAGVVAGFLAPGAGFAWLWALGAFSLTASILVRPVPPADGSAPPAFGNAGRVANTRQAAAEQLNINSATEAVTIPVVYGTCLINGNHLGWNQSTYRAVPIIERQQQSPQFVAYEIARETFESSPSIVDMEIDSAARKTGNTGGKGGGKGGRGKQPPPSQSYSNAEKLSAYTQILLEDDESGKNKLPKEYDEFVAGFKYYLTFEIGICCGEVTAFHGIRSYPGEKYILDNRPDPYIVADDTPFTAAGAQEGGPVRFYRGSGTQIRNAADPYKKDYNNYRGTCFAVFEDFWMGNQPAPSSFVFEVEVIPVPLDADGDEIDGFQNRAGEDTVPVPVTAATWENNVVTMTAAGHGYAPGDVIFHADFEPDGWDGMLTVSTVDGDDYTAQFITEPKPATKFGSVQGPPHGDPIDLVSAVWIDGRATLNKPSHGAEVDQLVELTGFTPDEWNGTWKTVLITSDTFAVLMPGAPGAVSVLGDFRLYPMPSEITAANWEAGVVTFSASNDFDDGDPVVVSGMEPPIYNGSFAVIDGDSGSFDATLTSPPVPASVMGTATGPVTELELNIQFVGGWVGGVVTFQMADAFDGYVAGDVVKVTGFTPAGYNGTYTITRTDGVQWSAALAANPGPASVNGKAQRQPAAQEIQSARWEAGVVTFLLPLHGFFVADVVTVAGMTPAGYDGTFTITDVDGDEFSAVLVADPGGVTEFGTTRLRPSAAYGDANPAAILWDLLTNKYYGRGISPDQLDTASFVRASQYYYDEGIGMSFTLESQGSLSDAIETIRGHVGLAVFWMGDKFYAQCLNDRATAYSPRVVLTRDSVLKPQFSRPAWPSTFNEMVVQFSNRYGNYQPALVIVQDDANFATLGQVNSTKVELPAISSREVATLIAQRLLQETSYPQALLSFRMPRYHSGLYPTAFVEFQWGDWNDGIVTTYYRVIKIVDDDQSAEGLRVDLAEDTYATPVVGIPEEFVPPVPAFEGMTRNTDAELYLGSDKTRPPALTGLFFQVCELPLPLSDGDRAFGILCQRQDQYTHAVTFLWKRANTDDDFALLGTVHPWAIAGTLQDSLPASGLSMARDVPFRVQLRYSYERSKLLEACSTLPTSSDGFEKVTGSQKNWLIIGNEFIEVAQAEAGTGSNDVLITAYIRGMYGSEQIAHSVGEPTMFTYDFVPYVHTLRYDQIPVRTPITIRAIPSDRFGTRGASVNFDHTFIGLALMPLRVQVASGVEDGSEWDVSFRPRLHNRGADIHPDITGSCNALTGAIPTGYEFRAMPIDTQGGELLDEPALLEITFIPDDPEGMDPATGMINFEFSPVPPTAISLILYQVFNGVLGLPCLVEVLPAGGLLPDPDPPDPPDGLFIELSAATLSGVTTADEIWADQDTATDGQNNNTLIDWTYTPTVGTSKPTLSGGTFLTGDMSGYPNFGDIGFTPVGIREFDVAMDCNIGDAGTWADPSPSMHTGNLFRINLGGGAPARIIVGIASGNTSQLQLYFQANLDSTPFANPPVYINIAKNARHTVGIRVDNPGTGTFDITALVDGSPVGSAETINFDLAQISLVDIQIAGNTSAWQVLPFKIYGFRLATTS